MISEGKRNEIKKEKKCVHFEKIFYKMDLTSRVLFQFMGYGAPAMAMQGLFYNQPYPYHGAALSREQLGAQTTVDFSLRIPSLISHSFFVSSRRPPQQYRRRRREQARPGLWRDATGEATP